MVLAVAQRGRRIRPQLAAVKSIASAICIGSRGREGPGCRDAASMSPVGRVDGFEETVAMTWP
jgi:hypothetical protein